VKRPVIAIGLDAADPLLVERWMNEGRLPALARLRATGTYRRLANFKYCRAEAACTTFLTGCSSTLTGRWEAFKLHPDYVIQELDAYEFEEYPPFYALGPAQRVAVFDLPQTRLNDRVNGVQIAGWGAHSALTPRASEPAGLLDEMTARYGAHPTYEKDYVNGLWNGPAIARLEDGLKTGIERRAKICVDLLQRDRWSLFLTYFGETHSAGHYLWHLSQPDHPLHSSYARDRDPLLEIFQAVDRAIATIIAAAPPDALVVLFSDHGMEPNSTDLPSLVFLPELLYRWSFPGKCGLEAAHAGPEAPPLVSPGPSRSWTDEVWARKNDANPISRFLRRRLPVVFFHYAIERRLGMNGVPLCPEDCRLGHQPPMWYQPAWSRMKAFALPSFSEGYIRLNVRGREASGVVAPEDYGRVCDEIEELLAGMRDARTGEPMVADIMRSRVSALDADPKLADADLLVQWRARPVDVVDTPLGRIGPMPFQRSGSHVERGFLLVSGPGVPSAPDGGEAHALDLAPTILSLVGAPIPGYMEGRPLFALDPESMEA
jgi:predicted AlkP superfamily phosphohydrolase/phosphomutase